MSEAKEERANEERGNERRENWGSAAGRRTSVWVSSGSAAPAQSFLASCAAGPVDSV